MFFLSLLFTLPVHAKNFDPSPLPPKTIYHVGQKRHLLADDAAGTIPQDVWDQDIMGERTRFHLMPYRRGLYGGSHFDTLELYGNTLLGSPDGAPLTPWVMKITIKDQCRRPEIVTDLANDPKFLSWTLRNLPGITRDASFCLNASANTCDNLFILVQATGGQEEDPCDALMEKFLDETKPAVVRDSEWDSSWYLRDRQCIERLEASPSAVLETLASAKWDWESRKSTYRDNPAEHTNGYGMSSVSMLVGALSDLDHAQPETLEAIRERASVSDIRLGAEESGPRWIAETVPAILAAYQRCEKRAQLAAFKQAAGSFAHALEDRTIGDRAKQEAAVSELKKSLSAACL